MISRRRDERGQALVTALFALVIMLGLAIGLLSLVEGQSQQSGVERSRDRGLNLSEGVLTDEAFVLAKNWPSAAVTSGAGTVNAPREAVCGTVAASSTLGAAAAAGSGASLIQTNVNNTFAGLSGFTGSPWRFQICDDDGTTTVWNEARLTQTVNWDKNQNNLLWVRAQSTVNGKIRAVAGLVKVRSSAVLDSRYGLVAGSLDEDIETLTNATDLQQQVGKQLLSQNPPVLADLAPNGFPNSGYVGLRCGVLDSSVLSGASTTCVSGAVGAVAGQSGGVQTLTGAHVVQYPTATSTDDGTIAQLRAQAKATGTYVATTAGGDKTTTLACAIPAAASANTVVFLEHVGNDDQYCVVDVSKIGKQYKALIVGSGRVIIRGDNTIAAYTPTPATTKNLFTGPIYALNNQTGDKTAAVSPTNPTRELVRIEKGARVRGAVHADGKTGQVSTIPPDYDSQALIRAIACNPSALSFQVTTTTPVLSTSVTCDAIVSALSALGVTGAADALVNGKKCFIQPASVTVSISGLLTLLVKPCIDLAPTPAATVAASIAGQLLPYGSAIHSDVGLINALTAYGSSGVIPGTFADVQPSR